MGQCSFDGPELSFSLMLGIAWHIFRKMNMSQLLYRQILVAVRYGGMQLGNKCKI